MQYDWIVRFRTTSDLFYGHYKYLMVYSLLLKGKAFLYTISVRGQYIQDDSYNRRTKPKASTSI